MMPGFCRSLCTFLLFIGTFGKNRAINVALHKNGTFCHKTVLPESLFDGSLTDVVSLEGHCTDKSYLEIHFGTPSHVSFVIIHTGKDDEEQKEFDFFRVYRLDAVNSSMVDLCAEYPYVAHSRKFLRVNCHFTLKKYFGVKLESSTNIGLSLAEIEVHSLAHSDQVKVELLYRGCFKDLSTSLPETLCQDGGCTMSSGCIFTGLQKNKCVCICKPFSWTERTMKECNSRCKDGTSVCGGIDSFSVYLMAVPLPSYKGCYKISEEYEKTSLGPHKFGKISTAECLLYCDHKKFMLFHKNERYCSCEDDIEGNQFSGANVRFCTVNCSQVEGECTERFHASVYTTCKGGLKTNDVNCSELFHCEGSYDEFGTCPLGCRPGYFGEHCLGRVVSRWCDLEPCNNLTSTCRNLNDSFICDCSPGYVNDEDGLCREETFSDKFYIPENIKIFFSVFFINFLVVIIGYFIGRIVTSEVAYRLNSLTAVEKRESENLPRIESVH